MSNELVPREAEELDEVLPEPFPMAEEAVRLFLRSGSLAQVGRELSIPVQDLYRASKSAWWLQEVSLRKKMENAAQDVMLTKVLDMSLEHLVDVLENGEDRIDHQGCIQQIRVSGATLARIVDVLFDKRQLIRDLPTSNDKTANKLTELAKQLEQFGRAANAKPIIEADVSDITQKATNEERKIAGSGGNSGSVNSKGVHDA
jgi:hypothetical protein